MLPDVLDLVRVPSDEALREVLVRPFYCLCVTLQGAFAPTDDALLRLDAHEEPSWRNAKRLRQIATRARISDVIGYESESNGPPTSIFAILSGGAISLFCLPSYTTTARCGLDGVRVYVEATTDRTAAYMTTGPRNQRGQLHVPGRRSEQGPPELGHEDTRCQSWASVCNECIVQVVE